VPPCSTSTPCRRRHRFPQTTDYLSHPIAKTASNTAFRAVVYRIRHAVPSPACNVRSSPCCLETIGLWANQRRVFDEILTCLEALERASEGGMTLGSVELALLLYFTPIAIHFAVILTLTEPICEARSLSVSSFSPGLPNFLFYTIPSDLT
jgi:hypothetical protein